MIMEKKYINMELNTNMDITSEGDKALFIRKKAVLYEIKTLREMCTHILLSKV